jgi:hypothetical protein
MAADPLTGGMAPPEHVEISQPIQPHVIEEWASKAAANEKALQPLHFEKPVEGAVAPAKLESPVAGKDIGGLDPFYQGLGRQTRQPTKTADDDIKARAPAASDTDSPTRGVPGTAPVPAGRKRPPLAVTGGFGDTGGGQYFPLNGDELKTLIEALMDEVYARMQNDLRFSIAICYPRVTAKVQIVVSGEFDAEHLQFPIEKVFVHDQTPIEVAEGLGDSFVFCVTAQRREFGEQNEVETPPDAMREELGLPRPRKQAVQGPTGRQTVDITW